METSGQGLAANKAMAHTPALPSQPVANLSLLVQRAQTRQPAPVQTSPCRYPMWCFRLNRVEKSPWPHLRRSSPFAGLYLGDLWPYRLQSTTPRCVFMRTILWRVISAKIRQPLQTLNQYELDSTCEHIPMNFTLTSCANRTTPRP